MINRMPKVSVNIPVYNDEKYIRETLNSALSQTYKELEVVIVDDGSTDRTAEIIRSYRDPRIKYHYQPNQGIGAARNKALELSSGKYIAFLDHDDLWLPKKLEKQIALFEKNPELGLVFCDTIFFNEKGDLYNIYKTRKPPRGNVFKHLLDWYFLSCETVVIKKDVLKNIGHFSPHMMMAEEYDLFLRIAYKYSIDYVDEPLAKYRIHEKNYSWGKELQAIEEESEALDRLVKQFPEIMNDFESQLAKKNDNLEIRKVLFFWKENNKDKAKKLLAKLGIRNFKRFLLFLGLSFFSFESYAKLSRNPFVK